MNEAMVANTTNAKGSPVSLSARNTSSTATSAAFTPIMMPRLRVRSASMPPIGLSSV